MRLTDNVIVHDPEISIARIDSERLRAHGWSEEVVQRQLRRSQKASHDVATGLSDIVSKAE